MRAAEILRKAAALVRHGWAKDHYVVTKVEGATCYCAVGALHFVGTGDAYGGRQSNQVYEAKEALRPLVPERDIVRWNDHYAKDAEEVASTMERAAASLEAL